MVHRIQCGSLRPEQGAVKSAFNSIFSTYILAFRELHRSQDCCMLLAYTVCSMVRQCDLDLLDLVFAYMIFAENGNTKQRLELSVCQM